MKKIRLNLILLLVLIFCSGAYLIIKSGNLFEQDHSVFGIGEVSLSRIDIITESTISFSRRSDNWFIEAEGRDYIADQSLISSIEKNIQHLSYRRIVEEKMTIPSKYGLTEPLMTLVISPVDIDSQVLDIGAETNSGEQHYASIRDDDTVYTIDSGFVDRLAGSLLDFREKKIIDIDLNQITELSIDPGSDDTVMLRKSPDGGWKIKQPINIDVDSELLNEVLSRIAGLKMIESFPDNPENSSRFGISDPTKKFVLRGNTGKPLTVTVGKNMDDRSTCYVGIEGKDEIYSIRAFDTADLSLDALLFFAPFSVSADDVDMIVADAGDKVYEISRKTIDDGESYFLENENIPTEDYFSLYVNLMALTADGYFAGTPDGPKSLSMTLKRQTEGDISIDLYDFDDEYMVMTSSLDHHAFLIDRNKVNLVKTWLERL